MQGWQGDVPKKTCRSIVMIIGAVTLAVLPVGKEQI